MLETHFFFFLTWVVYYGLHSVLASTKVKESVKLKPKTYRLLYSLFASFGLAFVLLLGASIYSPLAFAPNPTANGMGLLMAAYGIFVIKRAFRNYSFRAFVGLRSENESELKTTGLQQHIRHPLYTGTVLLVTGYFLYNPLLVNAVTLLSLLLYLPIGIYFEEKKLIALFGQAYINYKKTTPALLPTPWKKRRA